MKGRKRSDCVHWGNFSSMEGEFPCLDYGPHQGGAQVIKQKESDYNGPPTEGPVLDGDEELGKSLSKARPQRGFLEEQGPRTGMRQARGWIWGTMVTMQPHNTLSKVKGSQWIIKEP